MFGGMSKQFTHESSCCACTMQFTVFFPPQAEAGPVPVVYYLSGLTCDDTNFTFKAGAQRAAAELGLALVAPDTSPRGHGVEGEKDSYDFGVGAGFYVDATVEKWRHWRMRQYVEEELPAVLRANFGDKLDTATCSIMGHSMGGHGALTVGLRNAHKPYRSISAFSPIANPTAADCPWGQKALAGYLGGSDKGAWAQYDACELLKSYSGQPIAVLVDQGMADNFLSSQLHPERLVAAAAPGANQGMVEVRNHEGYDHSYFFIATFVEDHLRFHAKHLK